MRVHRYGLLKKPVFIIMQRIKDYETRTNRFHWVNGKHLEAQKHESGILYLLAICSSFLLISTFSCVLASLSLLLEIILLGMVNSKSFDSSWYVSQQKIKFYQDVWNGAEISHREKKEKVSFCTSSTFPTIKECIVSEDKPHLTTDNNGVKTFIR